MPYHPTQNYIGGQLMAEGWGKLGEGIASGVTSAIDGYKKEQQKLAIADEVVQQMAVTPDPTDPKGQKMLADDSFLGRFNAAKGAHRADVAEGLLKKFQIIASQADAASKMQNATSLNRYRLQTGNADLLRAQGTGNSSSMPTEAPPEGYKWIRGAKGWYQSKAGATAGPDTKKLYGITQGQFLDSSITKRGFPVKEGEGDDGTNWKGDPNGTHIRIEAGTEDKPKTVTLLNEEFEGHKAKITGTAGAATTPKTTQISPKYQAALQWLQSPESQNDPRRAGVLQRLQSLGIQ